MYVLQLYQVHREDPPVARNMPPIAGKILWVKQLFRRIQEPIQYIEVTFPHIFSYWFISDFEIVLEKQHLFCFLQQNSAILSTPEGMDVVKMYNRTAAVLVEFEIVYHRSWMRDVSQLQYGKCHQSFSKVLFLMEY